MTKFPLKFIVHAIVGNFATTLWFVPRFCKFLHAVRGVNFSDRSSVFISRNVVIDNRHPSLVYIGKDVWLTQGVIILAHSLSSKFQFASFSLHEKVLPVYIDEGVFIGVGSIICPGVSIGRGAYIGAGSVVTKNVSPNTLVAGNPAKYIKTLI